MRNQLVQEFSLAYKPSIHVDSVIGWAWLFFRDYDFDDNPLGFSAGAVHRLRQTACEIANIELADSYGVDFHKTGFCPYICSVFVAADRQRIHNLGEAAQPPLGGLEFGNYAPFTYTLESSRPATAPLAALTALKSLGRSGFQRIIGGLVEGADTVKDLMSRERNFIVINAASNGFATLFVVTPDPSITSYKAILDASENLVTEVARFNYDFYLCMLEMQEDEQFPVAVDYVAGYDLTSCGIRLGVMKFFPMSPYFTSEYAVYAVALLSKAVDRFRSSPQAFVGRSVPYRPKAFVTR